MSFWKIATDAAKIQVKEPTININLLANSETSINGDIKIKRKTPAVTIVAACIRAETGVGPSIASGNQV